MGVRLVCEPGDVTATVIEQLLRELAEDQVKPASERKDPDLDLRQEAAAANLGEIDPASMDVTVREDRQGSSAEGARIIIDFGLQVAGGLTTLAAARLWSQFLQRAIRRRKGRRAIGELVVCKQIDSDAKSENASIDIRVDEPTSSHTN